MEACDSCICRIQGLHAYFRCVCTMPKFLPLQVNHLHLLCYDSGII